MKLCNYQRIDETTPSGKMLFECGACKHRSPAPTMKRCGKCPSCGHHFGTLGHTLNCQDLDVGDRKLLVKLKAGLES